MRLLASIQGVLLLIQFFVCGFSFSFIFSAIARVLFACKLLGMRVKLNTIMVLEIVGIVLMIFLPVVFGWSISFSRIGFTILFAIISSAIAWYDDHFYVYIEEEVPVEVEEKKANLNRPERA